MKTAGRLLLVGAMVALAGCGSGAESKDRTRNAAIEVADAGYPQRAMFARFADDSKIQFDPVSKKTVSVVQTSIADTLYTGSISLVDSTNPWGEAIPKTMPIIEGDIRDVEPDGNGGWYVGGAINSVGNMSFERPRYIVQITAEGTLGDFNPRLSPYDFTRFAAVEKIWLDETTDRVIVATTGLSKPEHFVTPDGKLSSEVHYESAHVFDPETGNDVSQDHLPVLSNQFVVNNVINGIVYIQSVDGGRFRFVLDGNARWFVEAIDLRSARFTDFGYNFYGDVCIVKNVCGAPGPIFVSNTSLVTSFMTRRETPELPTRTTSWFKFTPAGVASQPMAPTTHDATDEQPNGWTVIGNTLYVAACTPGENAFVKSYSLLTGLRTQATYTYSGSLYSCTKLSFFRIGDQLFVASRINSLNTITRISETSLKPMESPFSRTVQGDSDGSTTEKYMMALDALADNGKQSTIEIPVSNNRMWIKTPEGLNPRYLRSRYLITDESGSPFEFETYEPELNLYATMNFQILDGWLYVLMYANRVDNIPPTVLRWNLKTLKRDTSWKLELPGGTERFAIGATAVLATSDNGWDRWTAYDLTTKIERFRYTLSGVDARLGYSMIVEGDAVYVAGRFNDNQGDHAVARIDMLNGSVLLSEAEPKWCPPENPACLTHAKLAAARNRSLVSSGQYLYSIVAGDIVRFDKTTLASRRGPSGPVLASTSGLALLNDRIYAYNTEQRQVVQFLIPSMEPRGAIGQPFPVSRVNPNLQVVTGLIGTSTGINIALRHPASLGPTTFASGLVAMTPGGLVTPGVTSRGFENASLTPPALDPDTYIGDQTGSGTNKVVVTQAKAGHRTITITFNSPGIGTTHRVVDRTGRTRCTTSTDRCVVKNLNPSVPVSLSVVRDGSPGSASEFTPELKPVFVTKRGATVKTSGIVLVGKGRATWTVRGGCRLNVAKTLLTAPKKSTVCAVRVKGGRGRTAFDSSARVLVNVGD